MEQKTHTVKLNMLMNAILTASSIIFPIITLPYVSRVLGPEYLGKVYFSNSVVLFFSMLAELGIPIYGVKASAKVRDNREELSRTVHEILVINFISCMISYILLALSVAAIPKLFEEKTLIVYMSAIIILNSLGMEWLYKAIEKYTYITVRSVIFKLAALAAMFMLVRSDEDYIIYGVLTIAAASASNILNIINSGRYVSMKPLGGYDLKRHLPGLMYLFLLAAAVNIYTNLDSALLGVISGDEEVGLYGVAANIKIALMNLTTSVSAVLLPRTSYYYEKGDIRAFRELLAATMSGVVFLTAVTAGYFAVFAPETIELLAGRGFSGAVLPLQILMPALIIIVISNVIGMQMMVPMDMEKQVAMAAAAGAAVDLALNLILIPKLSSVGAAISTVIAELSVLLILLHSAGAGETRRLFRKMPVLKMAAVMVIASVSALWVRAAFSSVLIRLMISACCYFAVCTAAFLIYRRKNDLLY